MSPQDFIPIGEALRGILQKVRPDMDDKRARDWLLRTAHMSSHVQHTEAKEGRAAQSVTEQTHRQRAADWRFSAVWEP